MARSPFTPVRIVGTAALLLLTACATTSPSAVPSPSASSAPAATTSPNDTASLNDTAWVLETLGTNPAADATSVTARFAADGTISGSAGCNRYSGRFTTTGDAFSVDGVASTMMACEGDLMTQEMAFLAALDSSETFTVVGDKLTLSDAAGTALVVFSRQSQDLADSTWNILGYNNGKGGVVSLIIDSTATITFADDGTVSGSGGCNRFMGTYSVEGALLKLGPLAGTKMVCTPAGVMEQETAILAALSSTTSFTMDGDKLRLLNADEATSASLVRG